MDRVGKRLKSLLLELKEHDGEMSNQDHQQLSPPALATPNPKSHYSSPSSVSRSKKRRPTCDSDDENFTTTPKPQTQSKTKPRGRAKQPKKLESLKDLMARHCE